MRPTLFWGISLTTKKTPVDGLPISDGPTTSHGVNTQKRRRAESTHGVRTDDRMRRYGMDGLEDRISQPADAHAADTQARLARKGFLAHVPPPPAPRLKPHFPPSPIFVIVCFPFQGHSPCHPVSFPFLLIFSFTLVYSAPPHPHLSPSSLRRAQRTSTPLKARDAASLLSQQQNHSIQHATQNHPCQNQWLRLMTRRSCRENKEGKGSLSYPRGYRRNPRSSFGLPIHPPPRKTHTKKAQPVSSSRAKHPGGQLACL